MATLVAVLIAVLAVIGALTVVGFLAILGLIVWIERTEARPHRGGRARLPQLVCPACHTEPVAAVGQRCTPCIVSEHLPVRAR